MLVCWAGMGLGCGSLEFGAPQTPLDASLSAAPDATEAPDAGDIGPPDGGDEDDCRPQPLPEGLPAAWPWARTEAAYRDVFWEAASAEGCALAGGCHGGRAEPRIPKAADLSGYFGQGADEIWALVTESDLDGQGDLWVHANGQAPAVDAATLRTLYEPLFVRGRDCLLAGFEPEVDEGPCGPGGADSSPADAGAVVDSGATPSGGPDAGTPDAGGGAFELCYCPPPDVGELNTTYCAP